MGYGFLIQLWIEYLDGFDILMIHCGEVDQSPDSKVARATDEIPKLEKKEKRKKEKEIHRCAAYPPKTVEI